MQVAFGLVNVPVVRTVDDFHVDALLSCGRDVGGDDDERVGEGIVPDALLCGRMRCWNL